MKTFRYYVLFIVFLLAGFTDAQLDSVYHLGPKLDSVLAGAIQSTDNFTATFIAPPINQKIREIPNKNYPLEDMFINANNSKLPDYVYVEDKNVTKKPEGVISQTVLLKNFSGYDITNVIPPDPTLAVGPNHIIACANGQPGTFRIYDKEGNLLKDIGAGQWWADVSFGSDADPQVIYDPYEGRWVLGWLFYNDDINYSVTSIAYSDDDDPLGTWYVYSFPNVGGLGDYPQLGFDNEAIYINTNQFSFGGDFQYANMRIINKAELYASNGGKVKYKDFWDIRRPGDGTANSSLYTIHPTYSYSPDDVGYHFWSINGSANFYSLFQVINPTSDYPRLRGKIIPVDTYNYPPNANQLGGGTPLLEGGGSACRTAPIVKDGLLFMTHSVANSANSDYSSVKYVIVDLFSQAIYEQAEFGAVGYYYTYPAIAVDQDYNIAVTFSRSADDEYIGAYYSTRYFNDPLGLSPSQPIAEGQGNYVLTYGGSRNRWGDYMGISIDPSNNYDVWMHTEFASATNKWATQIAQIRMAPISGIYVYNNPSSIDYGRLEIGDQSDTAEVTISNYGLSDMVISDIPESSGDFYLISSLSFPITLNTYDSLTLKFQYRPAIEGQQDLEYPINNNSSDFTGINLKGYGWMINSSEISQLYAFSSVQNDGNIAKIDKLTGEGTNLGPSQFTDIKSIAIKPDTHIMYAVRSTVTESEILRINSQLGDAYSLFTIPVGNLYSIAFDKNSELYGIFTNRDIYKINLDTREYDSITTTQAFPITIAFNPITNELWASYRKSGTPKDLILKIDLATGDTIQVGQTGLGQTVLDLAFDEDGNLYGSEGGGTVNQLISIDPSTAAGTLIGEIGLPGIRGLGYSLGDVNSVNHDDKSQVPDQYSLLQNYPNPFNPNTSIKFSIPVNSNVKLTVYNLLGQVVKELANEDVSAGSYSVEWSGKDNSGLNVSSGIYFYELKARGDNGSDFSKIMKMVYLK